MNSGYVEEPLDFLCILPLSLGQSIVIYPDCLINDEISKESYYVLTNINTSCLFIIRGGNLIDNYITLEPIIGFSGCIVKLKTN